MSTVQDVPIRQVLVNPAVPRIGWMWVACRAEEAEKVVSVCRAGAIIPGTWVTPSGASSMWYAH